MEKETIFQLCEKVRAEKPLVNNITNYVAMNTTANALLAIGASPIMSHIYEEMADIMSIASALVINMGNLSEMWVSSMFLAAEKAKEYHKPVVVDPVGAGASSHRTQTTRDFVRKRIPSVIRGNASEIMSVSGYDGQTKGVDSTIDSHNAVDAAKKLGEEIGTTVVVSGKVDYVVSRNTITEIHNGSEFMSCVTTMGCTATALVAAFAAVETNMHTAAAAAMSLMGVAGEMAARTAKAPGSFQVAFTDALYQIQADDIVHTLSIKTYEY